MIDSALSLELLLPELTAVIIVSALGIILLACMRKSRRGEQRHIEPGERDSTPLRPNFEVEQRLTDLYAMLELKSAELEQLLARAEHVMRAIDMSRQDSLPS